MAPIPPGKGLLGEKAVPALDRSTRTRHRMVERMPSNRCLLFLSLLLSLFITAGLANTILKQEPSVGGDDLAGSEAEQGPDSAIHGDDSTFSRLLSSASPQALHEFLHAYFPGTYKHGVYDSDNSAMEAVHATDPELATSIVQLAKRQQSGNDTTTPPTSTQTTDSSTLTSTSTPDQTTTTSDESSSADTTTTSPSPSSETSTSADIPTVTSASATDLTTTSPTSESTTATSTPDSTLGTTTTPGSSTTRATRTSTFTSTLPGGAKTTITSVEVVTPGAPEQASTTSSSSGSLQSGLAPRPARKPVVELVIGAVVGGALMA
ncbi:hypothetical protein GGR52DRAFT_557233 [Hypoxylon sp. FL1284]|nr:hypothetical protein GGR52DRAFT_557233 [Hypoxylon sp. FL1284]